MMKERNVKKFDEDKSQPQYMKDLEDGMEFMRAKKDN